MRFISQISKANIFIKIFSITKIPLMFFCRPKIMEISDDRVVIKIALNRRTKNHVKSMYFGALAVGADLAGGFLALEHIRKCKKKIVPILENYSTKAGYKRGAKNFIKEVIQKLSKK